jgi:hypothetical protein
MIGVSETTVVCISAKRKWSLCRNFLPFYTDSFSLSFSLCFFPLTNKFRNNIARYCTIFFPMVTESQRVLVLSSSVFTLKAERLERKQVEKSNERHYCEYDLLKKILPE